MSIDFKCPNGHLLRVKESLAGRKGFCPACKAPVEVPQRRSEEELEDEVLGILQSYHPGESSRWASEAESGGSELPKGTDQGAAPPYKCCIRCHREILAATHICPFCHTYVAGLSD